MVVAFTFVWQLAQLMRAKGAFFPFAFFFALGASKPGLLWQFGEAHILPSILSLMERSLAPRFALNIFGWQASHLRAFSCVVWGNMTGPTPAFFIDSILLSRTMSPRLPPPLAAVAAVTGERAISRLRSAHLLIIIYLVAVFFSVWHLVQSVSGKATLPWHLPHHSPLDMPTMLISFVPAAGMNISGWHASQLSQ